MAMRLQIIGPLFFLISITGTGGADNSSAILDSIFSRPGYDPRVRPGGLSSVSPTIVSLDFFVNSISSIDEINMQYTMSIYMRQSWVDPRLAYDDINDTLSLSYDQVQYLWVPDLFFKNEKTAKFHDITVPNRLIELSPNGGIYYSQRVSLTLGCEMDLESYPMDNQTCKIEIESYGYTTRDLVFIWKDVEEPVQVTDTLSLPEFVLDRSNIELGDCTTGYITGAFSCQFAQLNFVRQFKYYLIQVYVPTMLIVVLSWVSFFIDIHAVPARISLGLLTVLTMTTQSSGISSRLPRVSYVKAIDIWMTACLAFVFGALVEYSIVNVLARKEKNKQALVKKEKQNAKLEKELAKARAVIADHDRVDVTFPTVNGEEGLRKRTAPLEISRVPTDTEDPEVEEQKPCWCKKVFDNKALLVDVVSRFLFPLVFGVFNAYYWLTYYQPRTILDIKK